MHDTDLFHDGELAVQTRAGVGEAARQTGRMVRDRLWPGVQEFIEAQTIALCASLDRQGYVWSSLLQGMPGFIGMVDARTLDIALDMSRLDEGDPLFTNIGADKRIGLLLIDFDTRRRLRINGRVARVHADRISVTVQASYPNCPKYIQRRQTTGAWIERDPQPAREGRALTAELERVIGSADTLFVASAHPDAGADVSHRGGHPRFVRVVDEKTLRIPDYTGNNLFNTLGNFLVYPRAGVLIPDFGSGRIIQLTGKPQIEWDTRHEQQTTGGTHRYWLLHIEAWRQATLPAFQQRRFIDYSPFLPRDNGADDRTSRHASANGKPSTREV
jgi:hypothetical protein